MRVVLLRVGIDRDADTGGMEGPLFKDGSFEYIPMRDLCGVDERTYATLKGRCGQSLVEFFPPGRRNSMGSEPVHVGPEFETFTYGDPTTPKASLRKLVKGDLLVFYCGLKGWDYQEDPALYIIGYFEVMDAGLATDFGEAQLRELFSENFHVRHAAILRRQKERLVLIKGSRASRLLSRARRISAVEEDSLGRPLKVLSPEMRQIFGDFGGKRSIQRSQPRWVAPALVREATSFVRSLP